MSKYFQNLPDIYVGVETADERIDHKLVKNIFRRVAVDEAIEKYSTQFESYTIPEGSRPEMVAFRLFGDAELDWVILLTNNITDLYNQWPKNHQVLSDYVLEQYGSWEGIHHWETREVKYNEAVFVKSGIEVNETYRVTLPNGTTLSKNDSIYPVSNMEHETYLNEQKRLIIIPNGNLLEFFIEDFEDLVAYLPSKELSEDGTKKTPITAASKFLDRKSFRRSTSRSTAAQETVTSFDYGPTTGGSTASASAVTTTTTASTTTSSTSSSSGSSGGSGY